ncbi:DUF1786 domain-containing protein [Chloroflexota bacterium]
MRLLCLDIGTGTQDILLLDTAQPVENAIQLVLPAPTVLAARKIEAATAGGNPIVFTGETMGGDICVKALRKHLQAGFKAYATPEAARTFRDDLDRVTSWGVQLVSYEEAAALKERAAIRLGDVNLETLEQALSCWDIELAPDVVAIAVLDHGAAPPGESERLFRFLHLERLLQGNNTLESFIFTPAELPGYLTRMQAVVRSVGEEVPLILMDTGAAAVLGASLDKVVATHPHLLAVNLGNSHTLAFNLAGSRVLGLFEHHTWLLSLDRLETLLEGLVSGNLNSTELWGEGGHGSLIIEKSEKPFIAATGPRRELMARSRLNPYFAAPFGSMMLAGCFGLARAVALKLPEHRDELEKALFAGS